MFGGAYVVDYYSLALKAFFILAAYLTVLLSVDYIGEGDYYQRRVLLPAARRRRSA